MLCHPVWPLKKTKREAPVCGLALLPFDILYTIVTYAAINDCVERGRSNTKNGRRFFGARLAR